MKWSFLRCAAKTKFGFRPQGENSTIFIIYYLLSFIYYLFRRTRAQHIYYTTFAMCYSILNMHKYCTARL